MGKGLKPSLILHIGAILFAVSLAAGGIFKQKIVIDTSLDGPAARVGFPYMLQLQEFSIDKYDSGAARNYSSTFTSTSRDGRTEELCTSVNHAAKLGGWRIYQSGYDVSAGEDSRVSILQCVNDPFAPLSTVAYLMLILGGLYFIIASVPAGRLKWLWVAVGVIFAGFLYLTMARVGVGRTDLRPALRSAWFIPHICVYMMAYATLTAATLWMFLLWVRPASRTDAGMLLCDTLVRFGWAFLGIGMAMGALWAKQSWGDFWTWDPKECWALATWCCYGGWIHLRRHKKSSKAFALLLISYLCLQMCWWGVNVLPHAGSLHTY